MKITNIKIENFRNILRADINFENINIFTGKNSSGKSNFLLAVSNSIKTGMDFSDVFYDNIVTFGPGKSKAVFKTTISDLNTKYIYNSSEKELIYISPKIFTFENTFSKKGLTPVHHRLLFSGDYSLNTDIQNSQDIKNQIVSLEKSSEKKTLENTLVYERNFINETIENSEGKHVVEKIELSDYPNSDKFINIFNGFKSSIFSWVDSKTFSSTSIYKYVTERIDNNEIYDQIINFLKDEKSKEKAYSQRTPFIKAKLIHLLADIQKNEKQKILFKKDLKFYTDGLLNDLYINLDGSTGNKGEINVGSSNSPKDIFCISAGTAVMIYFILLKNWAELSFNERSFVKPDVMIFDEIDCIIHPSLMAQFTEILKSLSVNIQLFISSHSPHFIDCFEKNQLFWLKDTTTISEKAKALASNVYSYQDIINKLPDGNDYFSKRSNSELFIDGLIDSIFPII
jgi:predicted ATP-dependent endonuclease of OLD family